MGYVESAAFFCAKTETVKDFALDNLSTRHTAPPHHLENLADTKSPQTSSEEVTPMIDVNKNWESLSPHARDTSLAHVNIYLDDFIGIVQGGLDERQQMMRHLFRAIKKIFRPNTKDDTSQEEPISLKNLRKGDATWSTQKVVLGWAIDTVKQVLTFPEDIKIKLLDLIDPPTTPPPRTSQCSRRCWNKLLGTLRSTIPTISGASGMFTRLQYALTAATGR